MVSQPRPRSAPTHSAAARCNYRPPKWLYEYVIVAIQLPEGGGHGGTVGLTMPMSEQRPGAPPARHTPRQLLPGVDDHVLLLQERPGEQGELLQSMPLERENERPIDAVL